MKYIYLAQFSVKTGMWTFSTFRAAAASFSNTLPGKVDVEPAGEGFWMIRHDGAEVAHIQKLPLHQQIINFEEGLRVES